MDERLQRRVQRYGWDRAAPHYDALWCGPLQPASQALLAAAQARPGEAVLDLACGTGALALAAAKAVGPAGRVLAVDLSQGMLDEARRQAGLRGLPAIEFERRDAGEPGLPAAAFDLVLCALGLMYMSDPAAVLAQARAALRPGGRLALSVWGERARCGWAPVFGIVESEVTSDVCPLFFDLGRAGALERLCGAAGFAGAATRRLRTTLVHASADDACDAAMLGGPVALAWSRMDAAARQRARQAYLEAIAPWRRGAAYHLPAEFVIATARTAAA